MRLKIYQKLTTVIMGGLMAGGLIFAGNAQVADAASTPVSVVNSSFEDAAMSGWTSTGDTKTVTTVAQGQDGAKALQQKGSGAYEVKTSQTIENLPDGYYTLTGFIKNSGGQDQCYLQLEDYGGAPAKSRLTPKKNWHQITIRGVHVTSGKCTISLYSKASKDSWIQLDNVSLVRDDQPYTLIKGGDFTELSYVEGCGGKYSDVNGTTKDCFQIMQEKGCNTARLRIYNNPGKGHGNDSYYLPEGYQNEADMLVLAKRAKSKGMAIELTFHYSDFWSNGLQQIIPVDWQTKIKGLAEADAVKVIEDCVYDYTKQVMTDMKNQGTLPEYVSLGNETQGGMLYPYGTADKKGWVNLARFYNAGAKAVREVSPDSKIIIHLDAAGDFKKYDSYFDNCHALGVDYDIIGTSYYPFYSRKTAEQIAQFMDIEAQRFNKPVILMETGFAWNRLLPSGWPGQIKDNSNYPASVEGMTNFMTDLFNAIQTVPNGMAIGDLYWDPIMIQHSGVGWAYKEDSDGPDINVVSNTTLFDYDGKALPVLDAYKDAEHAMKGAQISGRVTVADGLGAAGATVTVVAPDGTEVSAVADDYGYFILKDVHEADSELYVQVTRSRIYKGAIKVPPCNSYLDLGDVAM